MCLSSINLVCTRQTRLPGASNGVLVCPVHSPRRAATTSRRMPVHGSALAVKELSTLDAVPAQRQGLFSARESSLSPTPTSSSIPNSRHPTVLSQHPATVEVHFQIQYGCEFGQHLSIIGTPQAWHVPSAVPMTWSEGNVWKAVLPVPVGTQMEYKYIVMWDDGTVDRWQEGPNSQLAVQHQGVLLQVQDTWSQRERSVREVGLRLAPSSQQKQSGGHAGVPAAPLAADSAAAHGRASLGSVAADLAMAAHGTGAFVMAGAARSELTTRAGGLDGYTCESDRVAAAGDRLQPPDKAGQHQQQTTASASAKAPFLRADAPQAAAAAAVAAGASKLTGSSTSSSTAQSTPLKPPQHLGSSLGAGHSTNTTNGSAGKPLQPSHQQQQLGSAAPNFTELLPLLRTELESALAELAKHPEAAVEQASLLSEGQAVLAALEQHVSAATAPATNGRGSSSVSTGRSPGRSPASTLSSGDELAAALLSDDCEEACFCMVDAICSCADWDLNCSCDSHEADTGCAVPQEGDKQAPAPAQHSTQQQQQQQPAVHLVGDSPQAASLTATAAAAAAAPAVPVARRSLSLSELTYAAVEAARYDSAHLAARAVAMTDVQAALSKSSQLLQALADPCHPLVLEADRQLATVSRQLHAGHLLC